MANIPQYIASRRDTYKKIPTILRILIQALSFVIGAAGFVLALTPPPFFDIGILLLLAGLSILSFQFDWAHRLLTYIDAKLKDKAFRKKLFPILFGIFILLLIGIFYLHIRI
jgi:hypothetical protein